MTVTMLNQLQFITPNWKAPNTVHAYTTTRNSGVSQDRYASLNLSINVGDDPTHVKENRHLLSQALALPSEPHWMQQVHGNYVVEAETITANTQADASYTHQPQQICVVQTADCLPILLTNLAGSVVAAIHGGWRSLQQGIISKTIAAMQTDPKQLLAWLGPAIGPKRFEVGPEVRAAFIGSAAEHEIAFKPGNSDRWYADIYCLARQQLCFAQVTEITSGEHCTMSEPELFYSYRRDGVTGRLATLIWIAASN